MNEIAIPEKLAPLVKAFSADDQSARLLIIEAAKAISSAIPTQDYGSSKRDISVDELEGIIALMKGIAPQDTLEIIYGAQIISSHLMGLRLLSYELSADQTLGLKLLRFSNEAMGQLQKKRSGGASQNINITYNHTGPGSSLVQNILLKDPTCQ